jgi:hypothetical protein
MEKYYQKKIQKKIDRILRRKTMFSVTFCNLVTEFQPKNDKAMKTIFNAEPEVARKLLGSHSEAARKPLGSRSEAARKPLGSRLEAARKPLGSRSVTAQKPLRSHLEAA